MTKIDLHVHTCYSSDSNTSLTAIAEQCRRASVDGVAITDHNCIEGALRLREMGTVRVIVGEEIRTACGELIGLFLERLIPKGLSPMETIRLVREQGGLVCVPHPLGRRPFSSRNSLGTVADGHYFPSKPVLSRNSLLTDEILGQVDMVEVMNARTAFESTWIACRHLADMNELIPCAGSDAHTLREIGRATVEIAEFSDAQTFMAAMRKARLSGVKSSMFIHFASAYAKVLRSKAC
ncbi:MAG: PHP domain-containing protein [Dehalococcoidia bacterium]|nr:PHP domain-containing protein [Dehalococcoidia bacterium]